MRNWSEVKEICDKATPWPWELAGCNGELTGINGPSGYDHEMGVIPGQLEVYGGDDAIFISVARTALPEAIAEIEQLLQEKAGLVDALTILDALMDFGEELEPGGYYCYTDTVAVNRARKTAHQLLAKLEGGEPNAKP